MRTLCRLLVLLLALAATGTVRLLPASEAACVHDVGDEGRCGDETPAAPCSDCAPDCAFCLCCPLRTMSTARFRVPSQGDVIAEALTLPPSRPVPRVDGARIFHPPRA